MTETTDISALPKGHPVNIYSEEKELIQSLGQELQEIDPESESQKFYNIFNQLQQIERRFERKENQLFPVLEQKGWTGPSKNMWSFHDTIREQFRLLRKKIEDRNFSEARQDAQYLISSIFRLLIVENNVLFPKALEILTENDWKQVRKGEEEIGWMLAETPAAYPEIPGEEYVHPSQDHNKRELSFDTENASHYDEGYMTVDQVNLLLRTMPLDLTFVDENDKVIFYNRGEERVFPRSAGIIGREVKFCHPPKSVGTVLKILEEFKKGTKNEASFWINIKGKLIYIRYFAVRDNEQNYRGVIEMSQDITDIKKLEGEQRLLDWE
ncbi:MAG: PAS domain-containing protein [Salinimicrobium sp.]